MTPDLHSILTSRFGFADFRPTQYEVCAAAARGSDVVLVMPTGSGKSLCYQLPALARGGCALVVSPLIALMEDQVRHLLARGMRADRIHSGRDREHSRDAFRRYRDGELDFLFVAPERFRVPGFLPALERIKPCLVAVDEAHCISQWGHDFRPDYRMLHDCVEALRPAPVIALTATATPAVQRDIAHQLGLQKPEIFVQGFRRKNIGIEILDVSPREREPMLWNILRDDNRRPAIIYVPSRKQADMIANLIGGTYPAGAYHAGMPKDERNDVQHKFVTGELQVIVATIAFGMGVDKPDVRTVVHMALPSSVEGYYQEIGRAGRDGLPSRAVLMQSYADRRTHDHFFERDYPAPDIIDRIYHSLTSTPQPKETVQAEVQMTREDFDCALDKLWIHGGVISDWDDNLTRGVEHWRDTYELQREHKSEQLELMLRYASSQQCRMAALVRYFGDRKDNLARCGICDFCAPQSCISGQFAEATIEEEKVARRVLDLLHTVGKRATGRLHSEICGNGRMVRNDFEEVLGAMARAGLLSISEESFEKDGKELKYRIAALTREGRNVGPHDSLQLSMRRSIKAEGAPAAKKKPAPHLSGPVDRNGALFQALRAWRSNKAKSKGVPAFRIFGDGTLESIVDVMPGSPDELLEVRGIGTRLAAEYGTEILRIVAAHASS